MPSLSKSQLCCPCSNSCAISLPLIRRVSFAAKAINLCRLSAGRKPHSYGRGPLRLCSLRRNSGLTIPGSLPTYTESRSDHGSAKRARSNKTRSICLDGKPLYYRKGSYLEQDAFGGLSYLLPSKTTISYPLRLNRWADAA
jgi:hypothetical protein